MPAAETDSELAGQEPHRRSRTDLTVGRDQEAPRTCFAVVPLEPRAAAGVELEPGLRVVLVAVVESEVGIVGRVRCQETEDLALGLRLARVSVGLVLLGRWRVVDITREEERLPLLMHEPYRVIFVPTFATEVYGVKALVRVTGEKLLTIHRHLACAGRLDRHVGVAGTRDELVELERVEAASRLP